MKKVKIIFNGKDAASQGSFISQPKYAHHGSKIECLTDHGPHVVFQHANPRFLRAEIIKHLTAAGMQKGKDFYTRATA
jgi:hypothetical protein